MAPIPPRNCFYFLFFSPPKGFGWITLNEKGNIAQALFFFFLLLISLHFERKQRIKAADGLFIYFNYLLFFCGHGGKRRGIGILFVSFAQWLCFDSCEIADLSMSIQRCNNLSAVLFPLIFYLFISLCISHLSFSSSPSIKEIFLQACVKSFVIFKMQNILYEKYRYRFEYRIAV